MILAAFKQAYNISTAELLAMNIKVFLSYLNGLPEDTTLSKIMTLRQTADSEISNPELLNLKRRITLNSKKQNTALSDLDDFAQQLTGG